MTKFLQNRPPSLPPEEPNWIERLITNIKRPSKKVTILGISGLAIGVGGYWGLQILVKEKLPPFLEDVIGDFIDRPIYLGEVKGFSLTGIRFGATEIPAIVTDSDSVIVKEIKVGFNIVPIIFRRVLPLKVTLVKPNIYAEQTQDGEWLNLDFLQSKGESKPLLIDFDVTVNVEKGAIKAVPYYQPPLEVTIDGTGRYNPANNTQIEYDLEAAIAKAKATIQGETSIETGKSNTKLLIKDLALTDVATLLPNPPVNLSSGRLNADLDINIPSFAEINATKVEGELSLQGLAGEVPDLDAPITARSQLDFEGETAEVNKTQASIGDIVAQLSGTVNWQRGYDLAVDILPFQLSSLDKILPIELPVDNAGEVTAQLQVNGEIKEPVITGKISNTETIRIAKSQFREVQADFTADLDKLILDSLAIIPIAGGKVTAEGTIATNLKNSLETGEAIDVNKMKMALEFDAQLPTEEIVNPYYQFPSEVAVGNLQAEGKVQGTIANPKASVTWQIPNANTAAGEDISGSGEILLADNIVVLEDTGIQVGNGSIKVEGNTNLAAQTWQTDITANSIALTPFLSQLQLKGVNFDRPISLKNANAQFQGKLNELDPNKIKGIANLNLNVDGGNIAVNSKLDRGNIQANAVTNNIAVDKFIANLPMPAEVKSARVDVSGRLQQLLEFSQYPNLSSIEAKVNANIATADGTVIATGKSNNNQWQTDIRAANLNTNYLLDTFIPDYQSPTLDRLNAQANLTGTINPILNQEVNFPIQVNRFDLQTGNQSLNAKGNLLLENLTSNLDVTSGDLDINADIDFDRLPIDEIVATASNNNQMVAEAINISGDAKFQGKFQGKNLISAPTKPGNIALTGDLRLENFAFNDIAFDPVMKGKVVANPGERIAINLRGKQDVIAAAFQPCTASRCKLPYVPTKVVLRQGEDTNQPVIAEGTKQGDIFALDIVNFPLAFVNLTPAKPVGIEGILQGKVTGEIATNLYTLATNGDITVAKPGIGYLKADRFNAKFDYDPNRHIAQVATASLNLKDSQYNFQGGLNLQSGEIEGKVNIPQAYIQDILTTFRWFRFEDLARLWSTPEYAQPSEVDPNEIITVNQSITQKLNRLRKIENQIQAIAAARQAGNIPTLLDIEGSYQGEITLNGTIDNPQANFRVEGDNWEWETQPGFVDIVDSKPVVGFHGLVRKESPRINLDKLLIQGEFKEETAYLNTATIQVEDTILSLDGQLSANQQNASYQVQNLTLNTIEKFTNIPVDVTGTIDTSGKITGTLSKPQIEGQIHFTDGSFNGHNLPLKIAGNYEFKHSLFTFKTSEPSYLQIEASVPYPIQPEIRDRVYADVKLTKEAFSLLGAFTANNLTWVEGEGTAHMRGVGKIDLDREHILYALEAKGEVNLDKAKIKSIYFESPLVATGKVTIHNQVVTAETLNATFAGKDLSVTGSLPVLHAEGNLDNPLTINLPPGEIDIEELYQGEVAGEVIITSSALNPVIGGEVTLENGQVYLPEKKSAEVEKKDAVVDNIQAASANPKPAQDPAVIVRLNDFQVNLDDLKFEQSPLYEFKAMGNLTLNGRVDDVPNLQAAGKIKLIEGNVNLFGDSLFRSSLGLSSLASPSKNFSLVRGHDNVMVFNPEAGVLNPYLDIQMKTAVSVNSDSGVKDVRLIEGSNEINDPIATVSTGGFILINLSIDGEAQEILPNLGKHPSEFCPVRPDDAPLTKVDAIYTQAELDQLAKCIEVAGLADGVDRQLFDSPAVTLTSNPSRSEGEIISLLSNQFINNAENLAKRFEGGGAGQSIEEILASGATQFVFAPLQKTLFNGFSDFIVDAGQEVGLDYLRVFPFLEGVYEINKDSSVRAIYIYPLNFLDSSNDIDSGNEFKIQYQLRF